MDKIQNMYEKIKIGSYQGPIVNNDFDANLEKVKKIIEQTSGDRLDFLCFPKHIYPDIRQRQLKKVLFR